MSPNPKVLIIDDSPFDRELMKAALKGNGFDVTELSTPSNCLNHIAAEKPDLVLLDIMMLDMDGITALKHIRTKHDHLTLPVIMVTSLTDSAEVIAALNMGANDYITKPVQWDVALRRIQTHLTICEQARAMSQAKETAAVQAMIVTFNHEINNPLAIACFTVEALKAKYSDDPSISSLEATLDRIADIVKKIDRVLETGSFEYAKYGQNAQMIDLKKEKP